MKKRFVLLFLLAGVLALSLAVSGVAQKAQTAAPLAKAMDHHAVKQSEIQWAPALPVFNPGAQMAVIDGDPFGTGMFIVRLKMPAGYKIMPHWHPTQENVTVISGRFEYGMGDKMNPADMTALGPGDFVALHAKSHHYAMAKDACIVQVSGMGPFQLTYVNPADDPSKKPHGK